jgi:glycopeptide antibiotics resistance protein
VIFLAAGFSLRQRNFKYRLVQFCSGIYFITLIGLVFFPIMIPENWPHNLSRDVIKETLRQVNLIPLRNTGIFDSAPLSAKGIHDLIVNLLMTIPIGLTVPYLFSMRTGPVFLLAAVTGLIFEGIELLVKLMTGTYYHMVDINDVIMNTLGVLSGYVVYRALTWFFRKSSL